MNARELVTALRGRWYTTYGLARCPSHDDGNTPALSITDGDKGKLLLKCFGGCEFPRITSALRARGLWAGGSIAPSADGTEIPASDRAKEREAENEKRRQAALDVWRQTKPAVGTVAQLYLENRGISDPPPMSVRYHPGLKHSGTGLLMPAMVAAICNLDRRITAVHRTYLAITGRKAEISGNKMALGPIGSASVHLAPAAAKLGIAEGIETALSAMQLFKVPVWCACGNWLEKVQVPAEVKGIVIFADRGDAGEQAAERAAEVHAAAGRYVEIKYPEIGDDFNDELRARAAGRAA